MAHQGEIILSELGGNVPNLSSKENNFLLVYFICLKLGITKTVSY